MKYLLLILLMSSVLGQKQCSSPGVPNGRCGLLANCPVIRPLASHLPVTDFVKVYGGCGRDENGDILLCCPTSALLTDTTTESSFPFSENVCESPSVWVDGLWCVTAIKGNFTWDAAKDRCQANGGRLVEGLKEEHLEILSQHFPYWYWIGLRRNQRRGDFKWISTGIPVRKSSLLWDEGEPDESYDNYDCGGIDLSPLDPIGLFSHRCSYTRPTLCQRKE